MLTPYYDSSGIVIYHGDWHDVLPSLSSAAVLTDPPYGVGKAAWDAEFLTDWMYCAARCAPILAIQPGISNIVRCPDRIGSLSYRWTLCAHLVNGMTRGAIGFGNWIPTLLYADVETSLYRQGQDARRFAIGRDPKCDHPSPKPLAVEEWVLSVMQCPSVIDPFMGSGTTLRAAKNLGMAAIGIEIEERYCEIAAERLSQEVLNIA